MSLPACLVFSLLLAAGSQAKMLQLKDVTEVMRQVTQPYVINKIRAENFTATSTDKLMIHLALIPDKLERAHHALMEAIEGAMTQAQIAEQSTLGVATGIVGISSTLESLKMTCQTNRFVVDPSMIPRGGYRPKLNTKQSPHKIPDLEFGDVMQEYQGVAASSHETKAREVMTQLLKPTVFTEGMQEAVIDQYGGAEAVVSLKDVVTAVQMVAKKVEAERMHNLRLRFEKVIQATRHVFGAYSHAAGLEAVTGALQGLVSGVDHSSGTMAHLEQFTNGILQSLASISCDE